MTVPIPITPRPTSAYRGGELLWYRLPVDSWHERLEPGIVWDEIRRFADVREIGEQLFSGSRSDRRGKWQALNDFARQARAYFDALEITKGTARGLLGYYSALNLAKAELLHTNPSAVINKKIHHGLYFDIGRNTTIRSDSIYVMKGVFPLVYEARTGTKIADKTALSVKRLLCNVPEVGREYESTFSERNTESPGWYRTVSAGGECWPLLAFATTPQHLSSSFEWRSLMRKFELVQFQANWREMFYDLRVKSPTVLQGKVTFKGDVNDPTIPHRQCIDYARVALGSAIDAPLDGYSDFTFRPSLYKSRYFPMPSFLARYALMFYLSSLIRYRPSRLNPSREQLTVWLLEAFARQSPTPLLANGLEGIIQKTVTFDRRL